MVGYTLATNNDATYGDSTGDPSVKKHQQDHDTLHGFVNKFDTAVGGTPATGTILAWNGANWTPTVSPGSDIRYPETYGAVGDGTLSGGTDDSAAFQSAVDALSTNGGTIRCAPNKVYKLLTGMDVYGKKSVVIDLNGSTLLKPQTSDYTVIKATARGGTAYGSSVDGLTVMNGIIKGTFVDGASSGASITLMKARRVRIYNIRFIEAIVGGHQLDLGACDDVEVAYCTFEGFKPGATREYVEAVSLDWATKRGIGIESDYSTTYDGQPCRNIYVHDCKFLPLGYTVNGVNYPAPNPIGCHDRVIGMVHDGVRFENNRVEGGAQTATAPDGSALAGFSSIMRGWIHFTQARNIVITGNVFINTSSRACLVINGPTISTAISPANAGNPSGASETTTPVPNHGWLIANNEFRGFDTTANTEALIQINGHATGPVLCQGIEIGPNRYYDCYPAAFDPTTDGQTAVDQGSYLANINYAQGVRIQRQQGNRIKSNALIQNSVGVWISDNRFELIPWDALRIYSCDDVHIRDNTWLQHGGGIHSTGTTNLWVTRNRMRYLSTLSTAARQSHMALSSVTGFWITENTLDSIGAGTGVVANGVSIYTASGDGLVTGSNFISNVTQAVKYDTATGAPIVVNYRDGKEIVTKSSGSAYTLLRIDGGRIIEINTTTAFTVTIPTYASVPLPVGTEILLRSMSTGTYTIAVQSGVVVRSKASSVTLGGQYTEAKLTQRATDQWVLTGSLT